MFDRAELLAYIFEKSKSTLRSKEVNVLVMAEECVYVVELSQDVSAPEVLGIKAHCGLILTAGKLSTVVIRPLH